jgi:ABC-type lipoprotein release transport system permease subunit
MARLKETLAPTADFAGVVVLPAQRPAEIVNSSSVGRAPALLASALALGATVSLGLALGTLVRRRRHDLAVLKALGFTRRQLAAAVAWQATMTIVASLVIGVPLGVVFGRGLWIRFAHRLDVVPEASVPWLVLAAITIGAVILANVAAAVPATAARRVDPSVLLRAE